LQEECDKLQERYDKVIVRVDIQEQLLGFYRDGLESLDRKLQKGLKEKLKSIYNKYVRNRTGQFG